MLEKFKHVFLVLGVMLCMNATVDHELVKLVREHVTQLSADVYTMKFENQKYKDKLALELKNMERHLKTRIEKLERAQDVLQREQMSFAVKVDNLATNQDVLQHQMDTLHQEQSSTAVKVDYLATNIDVLQHEMNVRRQEQSCTAANLDQLQSSRKASLQRVTDRECQKKYSVTDTISYGKYKLYVILPC